MSERADHDEADDRELSLDYRELPLDDLSVAHADDALLDALSGADPKMADALGDAELNALLLSWRREVDSEAMPALVDTGTAVTTIKSAVLARKHGGRARRHKMLVPVAAAAAVLAISFTGTSVAARDAQPGDTLWGLTKVLYADKARSVQAATEVRADFEVARTAISRGQLDAARDALEEALVALDSVAVEDDREQLFAEHDQLMTRVDKGGEPPAEQTTTPQPSTSSASPPPSSPAPVEPSEPVEPAPEPSTPPPTEPSSSTEPEPSPPPSSTSSAEGGSSGSTSRMGSTSDGTSDTGTGATDTGDDTGTDTGTEAGAADTGPGAG